MSTPGAPSSEPEAAEAHSASASLPHVAPGDAGGASPPAAALPPKHAPCSREAASWASAQAPHTAYLRIEYFTNREARALGWAAYVAAAIVKTSVVVLVCYKFQSDEAEVLFVHKTWWVHQSMLGGGLLWFCPTCHSREPHAKFEIPTHCGRHVCFLAQVHCEHLRRNCLPAAAADPGGLVLDQPEEHPRGTAQLVGNGARPAVILHPSRPCRACALPSPPCTAAAARAVSPPVCFHPDPRAGADVPLVPADVTRRRRPLLCRNHRRQALSRYALILLIIQVPSLCSAVLRCAVLCRARCAGAVLFCAALCQRLAPTSPAAAAAAAAARALSSAKGWSRCRLCRPCSGGLPTS